MTPSSTPRERGSETPEASARPTRSDGSSSPCDGGHLEALMASQAPEQGLFHPGEEASAEVARRGASPNPGADAPIQIKRGYWNRRMLLRFTGWGALLALAGQWLSG